MYRIVASTSNFNKHSEENIRLYHTQKSTIRNYKLVKNILNEVIY